MSNTDDLRALLDTVLDAIDIPFPATGGDLDKFYALLDRRVILAVGTARGALAEAPADIAWNVDYLRRKLAEHPPNYPHADEGASR
ncbi:hypothetical protein [Streptomyces sp. NBC_00385]|uniref:hypothetical protein n=1 Tax=Streptomyces sp. NBC_00385 TaxID=2975733 RepID=UPI002DDB62E4|nr:hypothetical protein [Streptomyces sp. NBC_00385]WRZ05066.1 hypothetical protein OG959_17765 [Streptomyces sp. NBC_00385]